MSTSMTETLAHNWVKYTKTNVAAIPDIDNDNEIFLVEELTPEQAEAQAVYGCDRCGVSMSEGYELPCEGGSDG